MIRHVQHVSLILLILCAFILCAAKLFVYAGISPMFWNMALEGAVLPLGFTTIVYLTLSVHLFTEKLTENRTAILSLLWLTALLLMGFLVFIRLFYQPV